MLYKLVKVTDLQYKDKTDKESSDRIGRLYDIDFEKLRIGKSAFLECKIPDYLKSTITSHIEAITKADDGYILTTENSIYFFVDNNLTEQFENSFRKEGDKDE